MPDGAIVTGVATATQFSGDHCVLLQEHTPLQLLPLLMVEATGQLVVSTLQVLLLRHHLIHLDLV